MSAFSIRIPKIKRKVTSYRLDPAISEPFVVACHNNGDTSCAVLEPFMLGYTYATKRGIPMKTANLTLNLTVIREVQREHRVLRSGKTPVYAITTKEPELCPYCGQVPERLEQTYVHSKVRITEQCCAKCGWFKREMMPGD